MADPAQPFGEDVREAAAEITRARLRQRVGRTEGEGLHSRFRSALAQRGHDQDLGTGAEPQDFGEYV